MERTNGVTLCVCGCLCGRGSRRLGVGVKAAEKERYNERTTALTHSLTHSAALHWSLPHSHSFALNQSINQSIILLRTHTLTHPPAVHCTSTDLPSITQLLLHTSSVQSLNYYDSRALPAFSPLIEPRIRRSVTQNYYESWVNCEWG